MTTNNQPIQYIQWLELILFGFLPFRAIYFLPCSHWFPYTQHPNKSPTPANFFVFLPFHFPPLFPLDHRLYLFLTFSPLIFLMPFSLILFLIGFWPCFSLVQLYFIDFGPYSCFIIIFHSLCSLFYFRYVLIFHISCLITLTFIQMFITFLLQPCSLVTCFFLSYYLYSWLFLFLFILFSLFIDIIFS